MRIENSSELNNKVAVQKNESLASIEAKTDKRIPQNRIE
jgi:hypothetical protein